MLSEIVILTSNYLPVGSDHAAAMAGIDFVAAVYTSFSPERNIWDQIKQPNWLGVGDSLHSDLLLVMTDNLKNQEWGYNEFFFWSFSRSRSPHRIFRKMSATNFLHKALIVRLLWQSYSQQMCHMSILNVNCLPSSRLKEILVKSVRWCWSSVCMTADKSSWKQVLKWTILFRWLYVSLRVTALCMSHCITIIFRLILRKSWLS